MTSHPREHSYESDKASAGKLECFGIRARGHKELGKAVQASAEGFILCKAKLTLFRSEMVVSQNKGTPI